MPSRHRYRLSPAGSLTGPVVITGDATITGNLTVQGTLTVQSTSAMSGDLDMNSFLVLNIGATGTDFTAGGGLNLVKPLGVTQGTITTSQPFINHTATWNNAGVTFSNIVSNVTNTASSSSSLLMDLQFGGGTSFSVRRDGLTFASAGLLISSAARVFWSGRATIGSPADGIINLLNTAETGFTRLNFGGTTSSFPSITRSGTELRILLADGTAGGILAVGGAADASAILTLESTTLGFLPPRMTTAQRDAIGTPTPGLIVYNVTTGKLNVRGAATWEAVTSV
jgi:hypothetical protein